MDVLICSRTKSIFTLFQVLTVSVICHISDKSCTTCLLISKSFKELFFMAFFWKADAKVRLIFELPKLFQVFLKIYFSKRKFIAPSLCSVFQLICVSLSKADAKLLLNNISAKCFMLLFSKFLLLFR